jgi:hypothetical protein
MRGQGRLNSASSERGYRSTLAAHGEDVSNRDPAYVARDDVKRTLRRWPNPNTQGTNRAKLVSFYDWMVEEGYRKDNPARATPRPKRKRTATVPPNTSPCRAKEPRRPAPRQCAVSQASPSSSRCSPRFPSVHRWRSPPAERSMRPLSPTATSVGKTVQGQKTQPTTTSAPASSSPSLSSSHGAAPGPYPAPCNTSVPMARQPQRRSSACQGRPSRS